MRQIISALRAISSTRFLVRRPIRRFITREAGQARVDTVVDVGCGDAPYRGRFNCEAYIGVDIAHRSNVPNMVTADVNEGIPLGNNFADIVLCTELLEHTRRPQFVLQEICRITKIGGKVIFTAPMVWPTHEAPNDFFRFTRFGLEHLFKEAGFMNVHIEAWNGYGVALCQLSLLYARHPLLRPFVWVINLLGLLFYRLEQNEDLTLGFSVVAIK